MFFSGKITNSVCVSLLRLGAEPSDIYELTEIPEQLLKDPTSWIEASKVEQFLLSVERKFPHFATTDGYLTRVGYEAKDLKSWGVLDSVLRMIEKPFEVITQPQKLVSYFVSPAPPIANIARTLDSIQFDVPIAYEEYPAVCTYLVAAFSGLPGFMGFEHAECTWKGTRISITLGERQVQLTEEVLNKRHMAPEFVESLIDTLERTEKALEAKSREIERIRLENEAAAKSSTHDLEKWFLLYRNFHRYSQQVLRLQDYFTRSQQLITLLVGQERSSPQVREAMKRVGWENVQEQYPEVIKSLLTDFESEKKTWNPEATHDNNQKSSRSGDSGQSWLPHN